MMPEEKEGIKTFPPFLSVDATDTHRSPSELSGLLVGACVRFVTIIRSELAIGFMSMGRGWVVRVEELLR